MPTLVETKSGIFYLVTCTKGKRTWRSLRTRDRKTAYKLYLDYSDEEATLTPNSTLKQAQDEFIGYVRTNFSPTTVNIYRYLFKRINEFFGDKMMLEITTRDIDAFKSSRATKVTAHTVNQDLRSLRAFFHRLKLWNMINKLPTDGVKDIRVVDQIPLYLTHEDLEKLITHTKGTQLHDMILVAAMTGLRRGELCNLRWDDVDFNKGTILIRSSLTYHTKSGKIRTVPMNSAVRELLEQIVKSSGLIFPGEKGGLYNGDFLLKQYKKAVIACGLNPKLRFHSLRHTFASLLVMKGVSLYHVQKLLGHSSPRVTEIYAHLGSNELFNSIEKLCK